jgi:hypothetical protein
MTALQHPESAVPGASPADASALAPLPPALRRLLLSTPEKDWPKLRAFRIESQEEGDLVEMLPELGRVMKYCPAKLVGRVGRREISGEQLDRAYTQLHDSLHGVRQAIQGLLHLAGFQDYRPRGEPTSGTALSGAAETGSPAKAPGNAPKPAHAT